jgi:two-component system, LytTR family, sensor kinase
MKILTDKKQFRFYLWIGLAYLLLWLFVDLVSETETFLPRSVNEIWRVVYIIAINYLFFEFTLPRLSRNKILRSFFLIAFTIFLYSYGLYAWRAFGISVHIYTPYKTYSTVSHGVSEQFGEGIFSILFFTIIRHIYNYTKLKKTAQQLRIEKQEAELNYLRSQTNPHFLFNTLNNIYSLARDKSDLAPESILRLSKILRFMLYETGGAYISVEQELKIISDYIALEKLRYDESLRINFNYDIEDMKQALPPLLLIPLVENAFKHGVSETRNQPFVDIHLSIKNRQLMFVIKNSSEQFSESVKENIGLSNLRRQLELLYTNFNLAVQQGDAVFTTTLKINLASHV